MGSDNKKREVKVKVVKTDEEQVVIEIEGAINFDTQEYVKHKIDTVKKKYNPRMYLFNFEKLNYISSAGISIFMDLYEHVGADQKRICFAGMPESVKRVFDLVGFLECFGLIDNINDIDKI